MNSNTFAERHTYAGVSRLRCYSDFTIIGGDVKFTGIYIDGKNNERKKYGLGGDRDLPYISIEELSISCI